MGPRGVRRASASGWSAMEETVSLKATSGRDPRAPRFTHGEELAVNVAKIEKELTQLWKAAANPDEHGVIAVKACLWNLIVHSPNGAKTDDYRTQLSKVYPSLPMRTLVMEMDETVADSPLSAWVSASCHLDAGGRQVCSEEITVRCHVDAIGRLTPLLLALQVPDVPSALW